jgi:3-hydroxyacyl-[acyl-carrier-protein] dehydratase
MNLFAGVDKVIALEPGKSATAHRNVPGTLDILSTHFPRFPVLPGVIILGSLGDLAARLLEEQTGVPWRMAEVGEVRYRHFVRPGDQMELAVEIREVAAESATVTGAVRVGGRLVTTARRIRLVPVRKDQAP